MAKNIEELKTRAAKNEIATTNNKPKTVAMQVHEAIDKLKPQMALALPKHITPDRLARIALTTIRTTPALMECSIESLMASLMQAAQLGLEPGLLGQCYLIPFNNHKTGRKECQFIVGYKGMLSLARRSGQIQSISAESIYSNDKFLYRKGFNETLEHEPNFQDRGQLIGFYAYATTTDGGRYAVVMTLADVNKIRSRSKAKDSGPWVTDFEEMGKKTVIRRLWKYLPMSVEQSEAVAVDEKREFSLGDGEQISLNLETPIEQDAPISDAEIAEDERALARNDTAIPFELVDG